ncbi:AAA family ATPase [Clostridium amazonitimonense]|uniref:AAA family ATPase n=1 Tax=Clostridium amazonitimonense TaxID=1499689 RepID=UPI000ABCADAD|nr:AAA family ATPase [Clostridium amazonitimonense]
MKRYILTGTPGSGKTSIIRLLEIMGYLVVEEAATDIIALEQVQGNAEPWKDASFINKIVALQKQRQVQLSDLSSEVQIYDRSVFCTYALSKYLGYQPSKNIMEEINRVENQQIYQKKVFFIENLGFCQPSEARKISFEKLYVLNIFMKKPINTLDTHV